MSEADITAAVHGPVSRVVSDLVAKSTPGHCLPCHLFLQGVFMGIGDPERALALIANMPPETSFEETAETARAFAASWWEDYELRLAMLRAGHADSHGDIR